jgi:hypothetical protein
MRAKFLLVCARSARNDYYFMRAKGLLVCSYRANRSLVHAREARKRFASMKRTKGLLVCLRNAK